MKCPVCHGRGTVLIERRGKIETRADCGECDGTGAVLQLITNEDRTYVVGKA